MHDLESREGIIWDVPCLALDGLICPEPCNESTSATSRWSRRLPRQLTIGQIHTVERSRAGTLFNGTMANLQAASVTRDSDILRFLSKQFPIT